ncbi:ATP-binding protein [Nocardioides sp. CFH 31398]|uniref:ATP-binding protein n=1 Tax=Nocardioides sp. CFH 31398 TaxID=2919579 RepID=UPI001F05AF81|nr:ATP-binding protein [Nocardioides sp. CFH 31398]MCH1866066.1 ATP-binding protein [Nocardioides sp. CFH 31398]
MSLDGSALALEPAPRSVQRARRWVAEVCRSAGREDLVESAEAGTSELVTNALLHAPGPIDLRVSGTAEHLRIEVHDASRVPPRPQPAHRAPPAPDPDDLDALLASLDDSLSTVSTVGRGLHIVATSALAWGAEITGDGKVVWFEPAPGLREDLTEAELAGSVYATGEASAGAAVDPRSAGAELLEVRLVGVPVDRLAAFRRHHLELRRELRLLALAHASDYPQAERLSALFADFEADFGPAVSGPEVTSALRSAAPYADLVLRVPADASSSVDTMLRLLDLADEFCRAARLLTLARSDADVAFAQWFLGEIGARAGGRPATPWGDAGPDARYSSP